MLIGLVKAHALGQLLNLSWYSRLTLPSHLYHSKKQYKEREIRIIVQILKYLKLTFPKENVDRLNVFSHMIKMHIFRRDADISLIQPVLLRDFSLQVQFTINKPLCFYKSRKTCTVNALVHSIS